MCFFCTGREGMLVFEGVGVNSCKICVRLLRVCVCVFLDVFGVVLQQSRAGR